MQRWCSGFVTKPSIVPQVMHTASMLTDLHGPRLTGSPTMKAGGDWVISALRGWGIPTGRLESWGPFGRGWTNERMVAQVTAPAPFPVIAYPAAWTPGTNGALQAEVVMVSADSVADLAKYRGKLRGKIVDDGADARCRAQLGGEQPAVHRRAAGHDGQGAGAGPTRCRPGTAAAGRQPELCRRAGAQCRPHAVVQG